MPTLNQRLQDPGYKAWIKTGLCLIYAKAGIEDFADQRSKTFHQAVLNKLRNNSNPSCNGVCNRATIRRGRVTCCKSCQGFVDEIDQQNQKSFRFQQGNWDNSDMKLWPNDPWEMAKVFMNQGQKATQRSPVDTDLSGILNFIDHCAVAKRCIVNTCNIPKVRDARNKVMHSASMTLSQSELSDFTGAIVDLLEDPGVLGQSKSAQEALENIRDVIASDFDISKDNETKVLIQRTNVLQQKTQLLERHVQNNSESLKELESTGDRNAVKLQEEIRLLQETKLVIHNDIQILKGHIDSCEDIKEDMRLHLKTLDLSLEEIRRVLEKNTDTITAINEKLEALETKTEALQRKAKAQDAKTKAQEAMTEALDTKTGALQRKAEAQDAKTEALGTKTEAVETKTEALDTKTEALDTKTGQLETKTAALEIKTETLETKTEALETKTEAMKTNTETLETKTSHLMMRQTIIEQKECHIEDQLHELRNTSTETDFATAARHLQETLIEEYKRIGFEVPLSPIYEGLNDDLLKVNIDELYTDPVIVKPEKKEEIPLTSYKDVFRGKERANRTIFLKGEAGVGKTTWCIQLLYAWVKTHDKDFEKSVDHKTYSSNSSNDKVRGLEEALSQFDFFFIVPLRYVKGKTSIKDVLFSPLLERLSSHESTVCSIIKRCSDKVLILLDGIDEYTEDLSYEGLNQCTVVTTSRPWKYDHICATNPGLKIDLVLALKGLDLFGIKQLAKRICMVKSKYEASDMSSNQSRVFDDDIVENFITHVSNSGLTDALKVPLTLIILLETYIENDSLSHSMTSNLVNLVEVLVQRGEEKTMGSKLASSAMSTSQENIIALFGENESLSDYACLLQKLSKLAFNGIISSQKENALVFSEKQLSKLFTEDEICLCLKFGLLSKSRYFPSKLKKMKESLSFYHKLVQEFFVATWIASSPEAVDKFKTSISSVTDILEIENVFIFVCGIDAHIGSELSKHFVEVCKKDCYTQGQITGVGNSGSFPKDLVNMSGLMLKGQKEVDNSTKMLEPLHILDMYYVHVLSSPETEKSLLKLLTTSTHCLRRLWCNQLQRMVSHNGIFKLLNIIGDAVELQELILSDEFEPTNCSLHGDEIQTLHLDFSRHEKLHTVTLLIFNSESNPCFALCLPILTALRSLPNLKYIDLCGHELDPSNILVEVIPRLQNLESLSLRNFSILSGDLMVESKELRNLVILGIDIEKSCVMLKTSCKLERVTIDDLKMSKTGWPVLLEQLGEQNDLIELHLLKIDIKGARLNFSKMGKLQDLEVDSLETPAVIVYNEMDPNKLTLKDVKMNASAWATLFSAFRFKNLKYLHFIQLDVGHAEIDLSQATQLETLAFTDVKFCPVASGNRKEPMKTHQERHIYTAWERIFNSLPTKNLRQLELSRLDIGTALIQIDTKSCLSTIGLEDVVMSRKAFAILHSSLKSLSKLSNVAIIKAKVEGITITMSLEDIRK